MDDSGECKSDHTAILKTYLPFDNESSKKPEFSPEGLSEVQIENLDLATRIADSYEQ